MKKSKLYQDRAKLIKQDKDYSFIDAIATLKSMPKGNFDESCEISLKLGIDPKQSSQNIRGIVSFPHGVGKTLKVAAIGNEQDLAGVKADFLGGEELINKIKQGWTDFDVLVTSPEFMPKLRTLGKVLGPKGLMPNPKTGTVTKNIKEEVKLAKAGRIEFRSDKGGNMNICFGKISFKEKQLQENLEVLIEKIKKNKPTKCKKNLILSTRLSTTMSPSIKIESKEFAE